MGDIITKERVFKTLMVKSDVEVVRSDVLAEVFGKRHEDVLRKIRAEILNLMIKDGYIDDVKINGKELTNLAKIPVQEFGRITNNYDFSEYFITGTRKVNTRNEKVYYLTEKGFDLLQFNKRAKKKSNILYVISDGQYLKIGVTRSDVQSRLKMLQTGNPRKLECKIAYKTNEACKLEQQLHKKFAKNRLVGEWFNVSLKKVKKELKELKI